MYTTMKDKTIKVANVLCLYLMYKANLLKVENHPINRMEKLFKVPD